MHLNPDRASRRLIGFNQAECRPISELTGRMSPDSELPVEMLPDCSYKPRYVQPDGASPSCTALGITLYKAELPILPYGVMCSVVMTML